jgi:hypothetical protein
MNSPKASQLPLNVYVTDNVVELERGGVHLRTPPG